MSNSCAEQPFLSVVIPAFNEQHRIGPTLREVLGWLSQQPWPWELLVVDDGSSDDTQGVVRELLRPHPLAKLLRYEDNRGKGHAVKLGMLSARGRLRLFMDADNSTRIGEVQALLDHAARGVEVVIGSRRAPGATLSRAQPWYRRAWSRLANQVVQAGLIHGVSDTQCGFKLFSEEAALEVFRRLQTHGWGFDLEVLALAQRLGYSLVEQPVTWVDDRRSRVNPLRDAIMITCEFIRIRRALAYD